jgi:hypothetical protein
MRKQEEIIQRMQHLIDGTIPDLFGVQVHDTVVFLTFDNAVEFLVDEVTEEHWNSTVHKGTDEKVKDAMLEYMPFAWEKANNCRGLSVSRTMDHYIAWLWLLGSETVLNAVGDLTNYEYYGKDNLVLICDYFNWDHSKWDDGVRSNTEY